ncbi:hypothetical protein QPK24_12990 [Paenibacillus polygoni]|uniref:Uncharacterized protein n=1 Tax=Paenibacillus polygoni TaxID=3050112 RepID=A0ABY8X1N4_9BACL|nr:hypothetical protein [Paenibacillus polygoni]WIV17351.1 hypothetical protein QPK24_12990 [Paenibacillus polygoni]
MKWILWSSFILVIGGIVLNFYLEYFTLAYALMGVLLLVISGWGTMVQVKNSVNSEMDQYKENTYTDDVERYTR